MRVPRDAEELDADVVQRPRLERGEEVAVEHDGGGVGELTQRKAGRLAQRVVSLGGNSIIFKNCLIFSNNGLKMAAKDSKL